MLVSAPMQRIRIIVLKRDADAVTETLGRLGVFELTSAPQETGAEAEPADLDSRTRRCADLERRLEALMDLLLVPRPAGPGDQADAEGSLDQIGTFVSQVERDVSELARRMNAVDGPIREAQQTMDQLLPYRELRVAPGRLAETSFLYVTSGDMPDWQIPPAREQLPPDAVLVPIGESPGPDKPLRRVLVLCSRRSRFAVRTVLEDRQFQDRELPTGHDTAPAAIYEEARARRDTLQEQKDAVQGALSAAGEGFQDGLVQAYQATLRALRITEARRNFASTWATAIITGWAPDDQVERMRREVARVTRGSAVFEHRAATRQEIEEGRVPSYAPQPKVLRPFQRFVHGFGEPAYREIEPTLMFAVSFMLLFGVIFGDLGHGLCLLAVGLITHRRSRQAAIKDLGYLIAAAGLSSSLFGAFFQGSLFGHSLKEMGFALTLGFEPLRLGAEAADAAGHVVRYLLLAIVLGVLLISVGLILNIINRLRCRDYEGGLLGRFGVVGFVFYWGALATALKLAVVGAGGEDVWLVILLIVVPLVVLTFHEPIYALLTRRRALWHEGPLMGFFGGLLEAVEAVMTYLANTLSFLRVAAFALSHAALSFTIFVFQDLVGHLPAGVVWSWAVFVLGTALVIGLEGLIVAIQVFRLEYYEFFTKFFSGEGRRFAPFRLDQGEQ